MRLDPPRKLMACAVLTAIACAGCIRAHIVPCDIEPCTDASAIVDAGSPDAGSPDAGVDAGTDAGADAGNDAGVDAGVDDGGTDAGTHLCAGAVLCDLFDDESLRSGLSVVGTTESAWTSANAGDASWHETRLGTGERVLASGPDASGSWWGSTCEGAAQPGPALLVAPAFEVGSAAGFSIDFDYFQAAASCSRGIVGVGLGGPEPALSWSAAPPHFLGDTWFFAMAGVGVELRSGTAPIFDTGIVGFPPAGVWYHFHVEVCADGQFRLLLTERDGGEVVVTTTRVAADPRLALGARSALSAWVFAEGPDKYFDNLRVTPGCTL